VSLQSHESANDPETGAGSGRSPKPMML